jgi:hypothetical protein
MARVQSALPAASKRAREAIACVRSLRGLG